MPEADPTVQPDPAAGDNIAQLRSQYDETTKRLATAERKLAIADAGVPLGSPLATMFINGYDGELTKEAITTAATEVGLIKAETTETPPAPAAPGAPAEPPPVVDDGSTALRGQVAGGAVGMDPNQLGPDPREQCVVDGKAVFDKTGSRQRALAAAFDSLVGSAVKGDKRAVIDVFANQG